MKFKSPSKRLLLINRDFQLRYTRASVAVGVVSTVLTGVVILYPLYLFKILVVPQFLPGPILVGMSVAALINIGMLVLFGILISHKIAGPMFSMVRQIRNLANGNWRARVKLREGDDLQLIVRNLNDLSASLVQSAEADLKTIDQIIEKTGSLEVSLSLLKDLRQKIAARIAVDSKGVD